jgi:hypothetical protein
VELYANGVKIRQAPIAPTADPIKFRADWSLPKPARDVYLVAIASGPGIAAPYWNIPYPYQPADRVRNPRVIGANNPVWIDADGDGVFTSPRAYSLRAK